MTTNRISSSSVAVRLRARRPCARTSRPARPAWRGRLPSLSLALGAATAAATSLHAQAVEPLRIEDATGVASFHLHGTVEALSPDGAWVAYPVCDVRGARRDSARSASSALRNAAHASAGCDIWLSPAAGGEARNITPEVGGDWAPAWSPDGRSLAYLSDRGGRPRVWIWDLASGRSRKASDAMTRSISYYERPAWTPDGRRLVVKLYPEGVPQAELDGGVPPATSAEEKVEGSTVTVLRSGTAVPKAARASDEAQAGEAAQHHDLLADLAVIDVATGRVRRDVRDRIPFHALAPDGRHVAFLSFQSRARSRSLHDLRVVDLATGEARTLVRGVAQDLLGTIGWSPSGRAIAYTVRARREGAVTGEAADPFAEASAGDLHVVRLDDGAPRTFTGAPAGSFRTNTMIPLWDERGEHVIAPGSGKLWIGTVATGRIAAVPTPEEVEIRYPLTQGGGRVWSPDGGASVVVLGTNRRTQEQGFYRVDLVSGRTTPLHEAMRRMTYGLALPEVSSDGRRVVFLSESATESPDLWTADGSLDAPQRLTTINPHLDRYDFGTSRRVEFRSWDGTPLRATLLLPAGYREGERYPMVVWVYASETNASREGLLNFGMVGISAFNMHMLTTRGYAVLWPDVPVNVGTPMQDLMKVVMPAVDRVIELGIADPERLAVAGQSNGGYSTLSLVTQTTRFRAAVMNAGFGDLTAAYGAMMPDGSGVWHPWLEETGGAMAAPPWEAPLRYVRNSPIHSLDRVETPLLIQAGTEDLGITPFSDQVFVGLKRLGKDVTYLRYGGEGHVLGSYPNLVDYWQRVTAFLEEHLGERAARTAPDRP